MPYQNGQPIVTLRRPDGGVVVIPPEVSRTGDPDQLKSFLRSQGMSDEIQFQDLGEPEFQQAEQARQSRAADVQKALAEPTDEQGRSGFAGMMDEAPFNPFRALHDQAVKLEAEQPNGFIGGLSRLAQTVTPDWLTGRSFAEATAPAPLPLAPPPPPKTLDELRQGLRDTSGTPMYWIPDFSGTDTSKTAEQLVRGGALKTGLYGSALRAAADLAEPATADRYGPLATLATRQVPGLGTISDLVKAGKGYGDLLRSAGQYVMDTTAPPEGAPESIEQIKEDFRRGGPAAGLASLGIAGAKGITENWPDIMMGPVLAESAILPEIASIPGVARAGQAVAPWLAKAGLPRAATWAAERLAPWAAERASTMLPYAVSSMPAETGDIYDTALEEGRAGPRAAAAALAGGAVNAALEAGPEAWMARRALGQAAKRELAQLSTLPWIKRAAITGLKSAGAAAAEGVTEGVQEGVGYLSERLGGAQERPWSDIGNRAGMAALAGAGMGFGMMPLSVHGQMSGARAVQRGVEQIDRMNSIDAEMRQTLATVETVLNSGEPLVEIDGNQYSATHVAKNLRKAIVENRRQMAEIADSMGEGSNEPVSRAGNLELPPRFTKPIATTGLGATIGTTEPTAATEPAAQPESGTTDAPFNTYATETLSIDARKPISSSDIQAIRRTRDETGKTVYYIRTNDGHRLYTDNPSPKALEKLGPDLDIGNGLPGDAASPQEQAAERLNRRGRKAKEATPNLEPPPKIEPAPPGPAAGTGLGATMAAGTAASLPDGTYRVTPPNGAPRDLTLVSDEYGGKVFKVVGEPDHPGFDIEDVQSVLDNGATIESIKAPVAVEPAPPAEVTAQPEEKPVAPTAVTEAPVDLGSLTDEQKATRAALLSGLASIDLGDSVGETKVVRVRKSDGVVTHVALSDQPKTIVSIADLADRMLVDGETIQPKPTFQPQTAAEAEPGAEAATAQKSSEHEAALVDLDGLQTGSRVGGRLVTAVETDPATLRVSKVWFEDAPDTPIAVDDLADRIVETGEDIVNPPPVQKKISVTAKSPAAPVQKTKGKKGKKTSAETQTETQAGGKREEVPEVRNADEQVQVLSGEAPPAAAKPKTATVRKSKILKTPETTAAVTASAAATPAAPAAEAPAAESTVGVTKVKRARKIIPAAEKAAAKRSAEEIAADMLVAAKAFLAMPKAEQLVEMANPDSTYFSKTPEADHARMVQLARDQTPAPKAKPKGRSKKVSLEVTPTPLSAEATSKLAKTVEGITGTKVTAPAAGLTEDQQKKAAAATRRDKALANLAGLLTPKLNVVPSEGWRPGESKHIKALQELGLALLDEGIVHFQSWARQMRESLAGAIGKTTAGALARLGNLQKIYTTLYKSRPESQRSRMDPPDKVARETFLPDIVADVEPKPEAPAAAPGPEPTFVFAKTVHQAPVVTEAVTGHRPTDAAWKAYTAERTRGMDEAVAPLTLIGLQRARLGLPIDASDFTKVAVPPGYAKMGDKLVLASHDPALVQANSEEDQANIEALSRPGGINWAKNMGWSGLGQVAAEGIVAGQKKGAEERGKPKTERQQGNYLKKLEARLAPDGADDQAIKEADQEVARTEGLVKEQDRLHKVVLKDPESTAVTVDLSSGVRTTDETDPQTQKLTGILGSLREDGAKSPEFHNVPSAPTRPTVEGTVLKTVGAKRQEYFEVLLPDTTANQVAAVPHLSVLRETPDGVVVRTSYRHLYSPDWVDSVREHDKALINAIAAQKQKLVHGQMLIRGSQKGSQFEAVVTIPEIDEKELRKAKDRQEVVKVLGRHANKLEELRDTILEGGYKAESGRTISVPLSVAALNQALSELDLRMGQLVALDFQQAEGKWMASHRIPLSDVVDLAAAAVASDRSERASAKDRLGSIPAPTDAEMEELAKIPTKDGMTKARAKLWEYSRARLKFRDVARQVATLNDQIRANHERAAQLTTEPERKAQLAKLEKALSQLHGQTGLTAEERAQSANDIRQQIAGLKQRATAPSYTPEQVAQREEIERKIEALRRQSGITPAERARQAAELRSQLEAVQAAPGRVVDQDAERELLRDEANRLSRQRQPLLDQLNDVALNGAVDTARKQVIAADLAVDKAEAAGASEEELDGLRARRVNAESALDTANTNWEQNSNESSGLRAEQIARGMGWAVRPTKEEEKLSTGDTPGLSGFNVPQKDEGRVKRQMLRGLPIPSKIKALWYGGELAKSQLIDERGPTRKQAEATSERKAKIAEAAGKTKKTVVVAKPGKVTKVTATTEAEPESADLGWSGNQRQKGRRKYFRSKLRQLWNSAIDSRSDRTQAQRVDDINALSVAAELAGFHHKYDVGANTKERTKLSGVLYGLVTKSQRALLDQHSGDLANLLVGNSLDYFRAQAERRPEDESTVPEADHNNPANRPYVQFDQPIPLSDSTRITNELEPLVRPNWEALSEANRTSAETRKWAVVRIRGDTILFMPLSFAKTQGETKTEPVLRIRTPIDLGSRYRKRSFMVPVGDLGAHESAWGKGEVVGVITLDPGDATDAFPFHDNEVPEAVIRPLLDEWKQASDNLQTTGGELVAPVLSQTEADTGNIDETISSFGEGISEPVTMAHPSGDLAAAEDARKSVRNILLWLGEKMYQAGLHEDTDQSRLRAFGEMVAGPDAALKGAITMLYDALSTPGTGPNGGTALGKARLGTMTEADFVGHFFQSVKDAVDAYQQEIANRSGAEGPGTEGAIAEGAGAELGTGEAAGLEGQRPRRGGYGPDPGTGLGRALTHKLGISIRSGLAPKIGEVGEEGARTRLAVEAKRSATTSRPGLTRSLRVPDRTKWSEKQQKLANARAKLQAQFLEANPDLVWVHNGPIRMTIVSSDRGIASLKRAFATSSVDHPTIPRSWDITLTGDGSYRITDYSGTGKELSRPQTDLPFAGRRETRTVPEDLFRSRTLTEEESRAGVKRGRREWSSALTPPESVPTVSRKLTVETAGPVTGAKMSTALIPAGTQRTGQREAEVESELPPETQAARQEQRDLYHGKKKQSRQLSQEGGTTQQTQSTEPAPKIVSTYGAIIPPELYKEFEAGAKRLKDSIVSWLMGDGSEPDAPSVIFRGNQPGVPDWESQSVRHHHYSPWFDVAQSGGKFGGRQDVDIYQAPAVPEQLYFRGGSLAGDPVEMTRFNSMRGITWGDALKRARVLYNRDVARWMAEKTERFEGLNPTQKDLEDYDKSVLRLAANNVFGEFRRGTFETDAINRPGVWTGRKNIPRKLVMDQPRLRSNVEITEFELPGTLSHDAVSGIIRELIGADELPAHIQIVDELLASDGSGDQAFGDYDPETGIIRINRRLMTSRDAVVQTLVHEAIHAVSDDAEVQAALEDLRNNIPEDLKRKVERIYADQENTAEEKQTIAAETIARDAPTSLVGKAWNAIKDGVAKVPGLQKLAQWMGVNTTGISARKVVGHALAQIGTPRTRATTGTRESRVGRHSLSGAAELAEVTAGLPADQVREIKAQAAVQKSMVPDSTKAEIDALGARPPVGTRLSAGQKLVAQANRMAARRLDVYRKIHGMALSGRLAGNLERAAAAMPDTTPAEVDAKNRAHQVATEAAIAVLDHHQMALRDYHQAQVDLREQIAAHEKAVEHEMNMTAKSPSRVMAEIESLKRDLLDWVDAQTSLSSSGQEAEENRLAVQGISELIDTPEAGDHFQLLVNKLSSDPDAQTIVADQAMSDRQKLDALLAGPIPLAIAGEPALRGSPFIAAIQTPGKFAPGSPSAISEFTSLPSILEETRVNRIGSAAAAGAARAAAANQPKLNTKGDLDLAKAASRLVKLGGDLKGAKHIRNVARMATRQSEIGQLSAATRLDVLRRMLLDPGYRSVLEDASAIADPRSPGIIQEGTSQQASSGDPAADDGTKKTTQNLAAGEFSVLMPDGSTEKFKHSLIRAEDEAERARMRDTVKTIQDHLVSIDMGLVEEINPLVTREYKYQTVPELLRRLDNVWAIEGNIAGGTVQTLASHTFKQNNVWGAVMGGALDPIIDVLGGQTGRMLRSETVATSRMVAKSFDLMHDIRRDIVAPLEAMAKRRGIKLGPYAMDELQEYYQRVLNPIAGSLQSNRQKYSIKVGDTIKDLATNTSTEAYQEDFDLAMVIKRWNDRLRSFMEEQTVHGMTPVRVDVPEWQTATGPQGRTTRRSSSPGRMTVSRAPSRQLQLDMKAWMEGLPTKPTARTESAGVDLDAAREIHWHRFFATDASGAPMDRRVWADVLIGHIVEDDPDYVGRNANGMEDIYDALADNIHGGWDPRNSDDILVQLGRRLKKREIDKAQAKVDDLIKKKVDPSVIGAAQVALAELKGRTTKSWEEQSRVALGKDLEAMMQRAAAAYKGITAESPSSVPAWYGGNPDQFEAPRTALLVPHRLMNHLPMDDGSQNRLVSSAVENRMIKLHHAVDQAIKVLDGYILDHQEKLVDLSPAAKTRREVMHTIDELQLLRTALAHQRDFLAAAVSPDSTSNSGFSRWLMTGARLASSIVLNPILNLPSGSVDVMRTNGILVPKVTIGLGGSVIGASWQSAKGLTTALRGIVLALANTEFAKGKLHTDSIPILSGWISNYIAQKALLDLAQLNDQVSGMETLYSSAGTALSYTVAKRKAESGAAFAKLERVHRGLDAISKMLFQMRGKFEEAATVITTMYALQSVLRRAKSRYRQAMKQREAAGIYTSNPIHPDFPITGQELFRFNLSNVVYNRHDSLRNMRDLFVETRGMDRELNDWYEQTKGMSDKEAVETPFPEKTMGGLIRRFISRTARGQFEQFPTARHARGLHKEASVTMGMLRGQAMAEKSTLATMSRTTSGGRAKRYAKNIGQITLGTLASALGLIMTGQVPKWEKELISGGAGTRGLTLADALADPTMAGRYAWNAILTEGGIFPTWISTLLGANMSWDPLNMGDQMFGLGLVQDLINTIGRAVVNGPVSAGTWMARRRVPLLNWFLLNFDGGKEALTLYNAYQKYAPAELEREPIGKKLINIPTNENLLARDAANAIVANDISTAHKYQKELENRLKAGGLEADKVEQAARSKIVSQLPMRRGLARQPSEAQIDLMRKRMSPEERTLMYRELNFAKPRG